VLLPVPLAGVTIDHPDAALAPIQVVGEPPAGRKTGPERKERFVERRVADAGKIDDLGTVVGRVDNVGLRGQDTDEASLGDDLLLGVREQ
jgi:hypothetical protein